MRHISLVNEINQSIYAGTRVYHTPVWYHVFSQLKIISSQEVWSWHYGRWQGFVPWPQKKQNPSSLPPGLTRWGKEGVSTVTCSKLFNAHFVAERSPKIEKDLSRATYLQSQKDISTNLGFDISISTEWLSKPSALFSVLFLLYLLPCCVEKSMISLVWENVQ